MKKITLLLIALIFSIGQISAQKNITLKGRLKYSGKKLANIWGYVDTTGKEYALVGTSTGLSIVDVTNPAAPVEKFTVTGPNSSWREVKTWGKFAYVTTEGGGGLAIVDLSKLPASIKDTVWTGNGAIAGLLDKIHALHTEDGFVYLYGANIGNKGAYVASLANPWKPTYVGKYDPIYIHDGYVRNDTMYAGHIYNGIFSVVDFRVKSNPILLGTKSTPNNFTHNTWLSDNSKVVFTTDETDNSFLTTYDLTDLSDIKELDRIQSNPGSNSGVHNTHILNDYAITSWYRDGITIVDGSRPDNLVQVGNYDTHGASGAGFNGCWGVYPFLPSGTIVASDMDSGLFVFSPTYLRGCFLEGVVTDTITGALLNNVKVELLTTVITEYSKLNGQYKGGYIDPGTFSVQFSKAGYYTKVITGVSLTRGNVTTLDVKLRSKPNFSMAGSVLKSANNSAVTGANVKIVNSEFSYDLVTDGSGNFSQTQFYPGTYQVYAGKWNYRTFCNPTMVIDSTSGPVTIKLDSAIYDDFTFDNGWVVTGSAPLGQWKMGEPVGTMFNSNPANPELDVTGDCYTQCYVTGNNGGGAGTDDVDDGNTVLTSPSFDLTKYANPYVNFYRWFFNGGGSGSPDDSMTVKISNGSTTVLLDRITATNATWTKRFYRVSQYLSPTANMKLIVEVADWPGNGHLLEGALDHFEVTDNSPLGNSALNVNPTMLEAFPNPFSNTVTVSYRFEELLAANAAIILTDLTGKAAQIISLTSPEGTIELGKNLPAGMYFVKIDNGGTAGRAVKVIKM